MTVKLNKGENQIRKTRGDKNIAPCFILRMGVKFCSVVLYSYKNPIIC